MSETNQGPWVVETPNAGYDCDFYTSGNGKKTLHFTVYGALPETIRLLTAAPALLAALNQLLSATVDDDLNHGIALTEAEEEARVAALNAIGQAVGK